MHPKSYLRIHSHRREHVHLFYVNNLIPLQHPQMRCQAQFSRYLSDIRRGLCLKIQAVDITAYRLYEFDPYLIMSIMRLIQLSAIIKRLDDPVSRTLVESHAACYLRHPQARLLYSQNFYFIQSSVYVLYYSFICHDPTSFYDDYIINSKKMPTKFKLLLAFLLCLNFYR